MDARWRFFDSGFQSGQTNMETDVALVGALRDGDGAGTVRVYGWSPWAISLGWNQPMEQIEAERAARHGIAIVRRPTGGRAILHANELTYSVAMIVEPGSVTALYRSISEALVSALALLGVEASMERSQPAFPAEYRNASSAACFVSSARYEVKVHGRKIVGSAQRRYARADGREAVLQHGSLLLGRAHRRLSEFLRLPDAERRQVTRELETRTNDLSSVLGRPVEYAEAAEAVKHGFEQAWKIRFQNEPVLS